MTDLQMAARAEGYAPRRRASLGRLFHRSPTLGGYALLSPALMVMVLGMLVPFLILVAMSFWSRDGFDFDTTFTFLNYERAASEPIFGTFLARSFWVSGCATVATVLLCYPMAY
ncbi:MAG: ABC transporter permease, partial [Pseudomonadota bacterium]